MGRLLSDVQSAGASYHELETQLGQARAELRQRMELAHSEGISMSKIANAAGFTREGVRYLLGRQPRRAHGHDD